MEKLIITFRNKKYEVENSKNFFEIEKLMSKVTTKSKVFTIDNLLLEDEVSNKIDETNKLLRELSLFLENKLISYSNEIDSLIKEFEEDFDEEDWNKYKKEYLEPIEEKIKTIYEINKLIKLIILDKSFKKFNSLRNYRTNKGE